MGAETATDVELLASGDAFIGTFTSNLGRLAFEVMSARLRKVPPFASIDGKGWYYGQSKCREKNSKKNPCPVATWMQSHDASPAKSTTSKKKAVVKVSTTSASKNSKSTKAGSVEVKPSSPRGRELRPQRLALSRKPRKKLITIAIIIIIIIIIREANNNCVIERAC